MEAQERRRIVEWEDPFAAAQAAFAMTGLEAVQAMMRGELPLPPIAALLDFRGVEVERGRAVLTVEPAEFHANNTGAAHGGLASTLLDSAMWIALHSTMPQGAFCSTLNLNVNYARPVRIGDGAIRAEGRVLHSGRTTATAEGTITDAAGNLCAHGSTMCLVRQL